MKNICADASTEEPSAWLIADQQRSDDSIVANVKDAAHRVARMTPVTKQ